MGVCFALKKRSWKALIAERSRRILLPFLFGLFCIVPLHLFIWQKFYSQELNYQIQPSHLWFLANIFIYVVLLSPLFLLLKRREQGRIKHLLIAMYRSPLGLLFTTLVFVAEAVLVNPETFETYAMTLHGFLLGLLAFFFGFIFIYTGEAFWHSVKRWKWLLLGLALSLFLIRYFVFQLQAPNYYKAMESCMWIFGAFGIAYAYLNRPNKTLAYLSKAAYPVYILHMLFLYGASYLVTGLALPPFLKLLLLILLTFTGCFGTYELIIKRSAILKPLFGLKHSRQKI
jgi:peptidoglycan/LPS O-acetylase OafA/YrhL